MMSECLKTGSVYFVSKDPWVTPPDRVDTFGVDMRQHSGQYGSCRFTKYRLYINTQNTEVYLSFCAFYFKLAWLPGDAREYKCNAI